jgi:2-amino-4-hydroxy-6-hydroxymethyldihydropteridine diphosphokinase
VQSVSRKIYVGLGSNLGEREHTIRMAVQQMSEIPLTQVVRVSSLYDTEPVGDLEQPNFLNAVALLGSDLPPRQLLWHLLLIEKRLGRVRARRWGPRPIDLDLLFYGAQVVEEDDLVVPHPELIHRAFVLIPLAELDPSFIHPLTGKTIFAHLKDLKPHSGVKRKGKLWL